MPNLSSSHIETEIPLPPTTAASAFRLERAVCSHGLFMMAPNHWDPLSNTLTRPLHLPDQPPSSSPASYVVVSLSQLPDRPGFLNVRVRGTHSLSPQQERVLKGQVWRMLRLSEAEEKALREFREVYGCEGDEEDRNGSFGGSVFRSPTLFEDMVKCMLLCNCQWSRTLSMAQALCELQLELQNGSPCANADAGDAKVETEGFVPKTPASKETLRKDRKSGASDKEDELRKKKFEFEVDGSLQMDHTVATEKDDNACHGCKSCQAMEEPSSDDSYLQFPNGVEYFNRIGNFPSPNELANLDERFLAKRCKLGYRAGRIIKLAQAIVEGKIQLSQLEELSKDANLSSYEQLDDKLKQVEGFGPFTRANVLMCMGYYHIIPIDSETIRHLKQVHSRNSTSKTIQRDVEEIYGKYEPYQFLAYWSEIWDFYEKRFGKMNEMLHSDYKLITASNMRSAGVTSQEPKQCARRSVEEEEDPAVQANYARKLGQEIGYVSDDEDEILATLVARHKKQREAERPRNANVTETKGKSGKGTKLENRRQQQQNCGKETVSKQLHMADNPQEGETGRGKRVRQSSIRLEGFKLGRNRIMCRR